MNEPTVIVGEIEAGRSHKVRKQLENLIKGLSKSTFDIAELLHETKLKNYYSGWGFETFQEYTDKLDIKARKAQYLVRIVDVMQHVGVDRAKYEPLGIAKLREITSLDPEEKYKNPTNGEETPIKDYILGFVEKADDMPLDEVKQHVRTLKGLVGDDEIVPVHFGFKKSVNENVIRPGIEKMKALAGSSGQEEDGKAKDISDSQAVELIFADWLSDPNHSPLGEQVGEQPVE